MRAFGYDSRSVNRRRVVLQGIGWLAGGAIALAPRNLYLPSISPEQVARAAEIAMVRVG